MIIKIVPTNDMSVTVVNEQFQENYHSTNGAITESRHIFIDSALLYRNIDTLNVFEVGFGTALNCLLTLQIAELKGLSINYYGIEKYPVPFDIAKQLNYPEIAQYNRNTFLDLHSAAWNDETFINTGFKLQKVLDDLVSVNLPLDTFDIVYFDAFSPSIQPEMWTESVFQKIFLSMRPSGVLTTYCAKGEVRRTLQRTGFVVERIAGPPGKREMIRATKHL